MHQGPLSHHLRVVVALQVGPLLSASPPPPHQPTPDVLLPLHSFSESKDNRKRTTLEGMLWGKDKQVRISPLEVVLLELEHLPAFVVFAARVSPPPSFGTRPPNTTRTTLLKTKTRENIIRE